MTSRASETECSINPRSMTETIDVVASRSPLKIAMALYGDISFDSRVQREAESLAAAGHDVTVYCLKGSVATDRYAVRTLRPGGSAVLPDGQSPFLRSDRASKATRLVARARWVVGYARTIRAWGRWASPMLPVTWISGMCTT